MTTTPSPAPGAVPQEPKPIGAVGRIFGALFSPTETFADIARKPSWVAPVIALTIFSCVFTYFLNQRIDWRAFMRNQIEQSPRTANMSAEQKNQAIEVQLKFAPYIGWAIGLLGAVIGVLIFALIFWGAFNIFAGAGANFTQAFGIVAHTRLPGLIFVPLGIILMYLKEPSEIDPNTLVAANLGALLSPDSAPWLKALLSQFDVFVLWPLVLTAIGFRALNPKKVAGKAYTVVFGVFAVWLVLRVGWALLFG